MQKKQARITAQKTLFSSNFFEFVENTIDFGNGVVKVHHDVYRHPAVSIFPLTENYDLYLIKQYRYLYNQVLIEAIAGVMENGESVQKAAKRELQEEAGIIASEVTIIKEVLVAGSFIKATQYLILARGLEIGEAAPEGTESIEVIKIPLHEAVEKVLTGEIGTASSIIGILLLSEMKKRGEI